VTAPSNCKVEFAKKSSIGRFDPSSLTSERSRCAPSACFRHSDFCWKARSRFVLAIALELLIAFVERAAANMGDFQLSDGDAPTVAEICRKLDGLPVAIEFATAPRRSVFGPPPRGTLIRALATADERPSDTLISRVPGWTIR
jgi:hypothetical protein